MVARPGTHCAQTGSQAHLRCDGLGQVRAQVDVSVAAALLEMVAPSSEAGGRVPAAEDAGRGAAAGAVGSGGGGPGGGDSEVCAHRVTTRRQPQALG